MSPPLPLEDLRAIVDRTRAHWVQAAGSAFFFTGGTGFVGRWMLESLFHASDTLDLDLSATVLTRSPASFIERCPHLAARCTLLPGDVRDFADPSGRFPYIIHGAADTGAVPDAIYAGTARVLDFAARQCRQGVLFLSSGAVYGEQPPEVTRRAEAGPCFPRCDYGRGKAFSEDLCSYYVEEQALPIRIARLFALIGPGLPLDSRYAAGNFVRDALTGGPINVQGNGQPMRSWLYAADMAAWLWTILFAGRIGRAYNVGSPDAVSILGLARTVSVQAANPPLQVGIAHPPDHLRPPPRYVPDVTSAATELGLRAEVPLPEAVRRTLAWYRRIPEPRLERSAFTRLTPPPPA